MKRTFRVHALHRIEGVILALVLCALPVSAHYAATEDAPPIILVFGDSLSAGYGIPLERGWAALLQERLADEGFPHRVVNASISGETSAGGRSRIGQALADHAPAIVILELGGNDGLQGMPLDALAENLAQMITLSRAAGADVVLVGMRIPPNYGPYYANAFEGIYTSLGESERTRVVEFLLEGVATKPNMMQDDGIHPTEAGQPRMLENVWRELVPLLDGQA